MFRLVENPVALSISVDIVCKGLASGFFLGKFESQSTELRPRSTTRMLALLLADGCEKILRVFYFFFFRVEQLGQLQQKTNWQFAWMDTTQCSIRVQLKRRRRTVHSTAKKTTITTTTKRNWAIFSEKSGGEKGVNKPGHKLIAVLCRNILKKPTTKERERETHFFFIFKKLLHCTRKRRRKKQESGRSTSRGFCKSLPDLERHFCFCCFILLALETG